MPKYRKKPVVIEAWAVAELNAAASDAWLALPEVVRDAYEEGTFIFGALDPDDGTRGIVVCTLEGNMDAHHDDWIIRGVAGEFYPCKPDIFAATYESWDVPIPEES